MATVRAYCLCGASMTLYGTNWPGLKKAMAMWWESHTGEGHGQATRQQAYMARIRNDQRTAQEVRGETAFQPAVGLDV